MVIDMNETRLKTVAQLRAFFNGTLAVEFQPIGEDSLRYEHIAAVLRRLGYRRLKRGDKGVVLRYLERTTGYSRQQLTRLVRRGLEGEVLAKRYAPPRVGFRRKFTPADVALLAETRCMARCPAPRQNTSCSAALALLALRQLVQYVSRLVYSTVDPGSAEDLR